METEMIAHPQMDEEIHQKQIALAAAIINECEQFIVIGFKVIDGERMVRKAYYVNVLDGWLDSILSEFGWLGRCFLEMYKRASQGNGSISETAPGGHDD